MELPLAEKLQREQVIKKLRVLPRSFEPISIASRREQDSNLRTGFAGYTLSRRASSTTRAPLLAVKISIAAAKVIKIREKGEGKREKVLSLNVFYPLALQLK